MSYKKFKRMKKYLIILIFIVASCNNKSVQEKQTNKTTHKQVNNKNLTEYKITLNTTMDNNTYTIGDTININFNSDAKTNPDSVKLFVDNKNINTFINNQPLCWNTENSRVGNINMNFTFYWGDSIQQTKGLRIILKSDIEPKKYTYKIIQTWKHNEKAYTQGLEFNNGILYEGTGQYGESMLTKIDLEKSNIIESINLPADVFGEGITIIDDKIYQLTWKSSIGYVYNKKTLNKLYDFNYPTDGWGLTNNGKELIMSDGTENIYFLDKEYFSEIRRIQVFDNNGLIKNLNELEIINGLVYANIYGTYKIIAFNPETGKVMKEIDLTGIEKNEKNQTKIDVLNGIAFDKNKDKLIVTGKWWSKFYQIKLIEK